MRALVTLTLLLALVGSATSAASRRITPTVGGRDDRVRRAWEMRLAMNNVVDPDHRRDEASHAFTVVVAALRTGALCWRCVASKAGLDAMHFDEVLMHVRRVQSVRLSLGPCGSCGQDTLLYRIA